MDTSVRVARGMARGRKGRGPRGPIGDADSRSTSGPDPAAEDIRIVTKVQQGKLTGTRLDSSSEDVNDCVEQESATQTTT